METQNQLIVKSVLNSWYSRLEAADNAFNALTDEQLQNEVAPNKNRAIYLLGHLTAVHDKMLPLLNFDQELYPHLDAVFLGKPDKSVVEIPYAKDLRSYWKNVNAKLATHFNNLQPDQWFQKHSSVSAEDFIKEPHRNLLNVVIGRTNHLAYHLGQLALLKK